MYARATPSVPDPNPTKNLAITITQAAIEEGKNPANANTVLNIMTINVPSIRDNLDEPHLSANSPSGYEDTSLPTEKAEIAIEDKNCGLEVPVEVMYGIKVGKMIPNCLSNPKYKPLGSSDRKT